MPKLTVKLNSGEVRKWLKSDEMMRLMESRADEAAAALGLKSKSVEQTPYTGKTRAIVYLDGEN